MKTTNDETCNSNVPRKVESTVVKIVFYVIAYLALLLPSLILAMDRLANIADPPTLKIPDSFWTSGWGQFLWFGSAFAAPVVILVIFDFVLQRVWPAFEKNSDVAA